jgi:hypothetical protein
MTNTEIAEFTAICIGIVLQVGCLGDILRREFAVRNLKLVWFLTVAFTSWFGIALYLSFGRKQGMLPRIPTAA